MEQHKSTNITLLSIDEISTINNASGICKIDITKLNSQFKISNTINVPNETININIGIRYVYSGKSIFEMNCDLLFGIIGLGDIVTKDETYNTVTFSVDVMPMLLSISYGTMRGMVFKETQNTILKDYPLPLMSTKVLCENMVITMN